MKLEELIDELAEEGFGNEVDFDDTMDEARAIARLMQHPDWKVFVKLVRREWVVAYRRFERAESADMRLFCQGAVLQTRRLAQMPENAVLRADRMRRSREPEDLETGGVAYASSIQPD